MGERGLHPGDLHLEGLPPGGLHQGGLDRSPSKIHGILWDTVNKRAVHILLACFLVY